MKNKILFLLCFPAIICMAVTCKKQTTTGQVTPPKDSSLVNLSHLNYLYVPVTFTDGTNAAGVWIYAEAPNYHP